jgi:hypothetical protein
MITKKQYVEYLVSTPKNCTCTYLAEHVADVSPEVVNDFLHQKRFMPRAVWKLGTERIEDPPAACLSVDDRVQDNRYSRFLELVRAQDRGKEHGVVRGIGLGSLGPSAGKDADCSPLEYRVEAPEVEGKTKNEHCPERFVNAVAQQPSQARTSGCAGWDAAAANLQLIHRRQGTCFTPLKSTRWGSLSKEPGYIPLAGLEWTPDRLAYGVLGKVKDVPFKVRLFKLVAPDGASDWVLTHDLDETVTAQGAADSRAVRGQVEALHRGCGCHTEQGSTRQHSGVGK